MLNDIWFYTTLISLGVLAFALSHNITTAAALRKGLGDAYKAKLAEWRAKP